MAKQLFANNVSVTINEFLTATDTTITVSSTSRFPTISGGDWIMATIVPIGGQGTPEVVKITAVSGSNLTVVRGQEGTIAQSFTYGALLELRVTKGSLEWLRDQATIFVDAITAVNTTSMVDGTVLYAKGRSTVDDAAGGVFRYVAGSTQATDAGTVFAPAVGPGRLFRDGWTAFGFNGPLEVRWFGAKGDGVADDTAAIQAAQDAASAQGGGDLHFGGGDYKLTAPINWSARVNLRGEGGHLASRVFGTHAGNLFQYVGIDTCEVSGLAFDGAGCTAFRQTGVGANYTQSVIWTGCHFYGQLAECIYGNLILCKIRDSTFGYYGTVGAAHRHIVSLASATNLTNANMLEGNRFFYAKGNESIRFDSGEGLLCLGNNWEQNTALPLRLNGIINVKIWDNYFEANTVATSEIEINAGTNVIDSQPADIRGNEFHPSASITNLVKINNSLSKVAFDFNTGSGMAGKTVSNNAAKIVSHLGNVFVDLATNNYTRYELTAAPAYDPPSLANGTGVTVPITVNGAALGDRTEVTFSLDLQGIILTSWVSAANTVSARFQNETGATIDLASGILSAWVKKAN